MGELLECKFQSLHSAGLRPLMDPKGIKMKILYQNEFFCTKMEFSIPKRINIIKIYNKKYITLLKTKLKGPKGVKK